MTDELIKIVETSTKLANSHTELKHWCEGLAELVISQLSDGDQEKKNLLYLQLEQNMLKSKRGEL
jgi:hypothetical protein